MLIVIDFKDIKDITNRLKNEKNYPTIDLDALMDYIIQSYMVDYRYIDHVLFDCLEGISSVHESQEDLCIFEKMVKDIHNLILCVFSQLDLVIKEPLLVNSYNSVRTIKTWKSVYVLQFD